LPAVAIDDAALQPTSGAIDAVDDGDSVPLYCYRHPKSETYVRCGRCDQPICPKCAVQGPVGFRCRQCGLVKSATLSSFTPQQLALGLGASVGGGALLGFIGGQMGFFSIFVGFFGGGLIAEAFVRMVGMKRGPLMRAMLYGGMVAGILGGAALQTLWFLGSLGVDGEAFPIDLWLQSMAPYLLIGLGAAVAGAYSRVRWF
jgi:hypothetical protein